MPNREQDLSMYGKCVALSILIYMALMLAYGCSDVDSLSMQESEEASAVSSLQIQDRSFPDDLAMPNDVASEVAENVVMTLNGDANTVVLVGEEYLEPGCHAVQRCDTVIEDIEISGNVNTVTPGDYEVTYRATTEDGRYAEATRTVHVVDSMNSATDVPVLMYHWVYTADDEPDDLNGNYILNTDLEEQLQYLADSDYYYPSFEELRAFVDGNHSLPEKSIIVTFDDGEQGFLDYGIPLLEKYEVPATSFYICVDDDPDDGSMLRTLAYASPYLRFQSHSYGMHTGGSGVGKGGIIHVKGKQEIYEDAKKAESILGDVEAFAYPFGDNNETAWAALEEAGILCAFTVENGHVLPGDNPYALPRVRISGNSSLAGFQQAIS